MTDTITLTGLVATVPRHLVTGEGLTITSFRLASTQRRFDRAQNSWVDGETNWYTVTAFRQLAVNVANSIKKGERILATGRLRIREWQSGEKAGTTIEIEADAVGHDLSWGSSSFSRIIAATGTKQLSDVVGTGERAVGSEAIPAELAQSDEHGESAEDAENTESAQVPVPF